MLPWYVSGNLDPGQREQIRIHLQVCPECSREVRRLESLRGAMRTQRLASPGSGHAEVEELVALESGSPALAGAARERLEGHLKDCADCREDFESLRKASGRMSRQGRLLPAGPDIAALGRIRLMGLAAAILVAIVGFAAALMLRQAPEVRIVLTPGLRGVEQAPALPGAGPWRLTVVLPFEAPDGTYALTLARPNGRPIEDGLARTVETRNSRLDLTLPPLTDAGVYRLSVRPVDESEGASWVYLFRAGVGASPGADISP